jgi:hypothetical protein
MRKLIGLLVLVCWAGWPAAALSSVISSADFFSLYENPSTTIDFSTLKDGTTYEQAATASSGTNEPLTGESVTAGAFGSTGYLVRDWAWSDDFSLRSRYNSSGGSYFQAVYWYSGGIASGLALPPSPGHVFNLIFNGVEAQPFTIDITSDTINGTLGFIPDSDGDINFNLSAPNWRISGLDMGYQSVEVSPVPLPAAAWLFISAIAGLAGAKRLSRSKGSA